MISGLIAWVSSAYATSGEITIESLGGLYPMLIGNLTVFVISGVISIGHGLLSSQEFDFDSLKDKFKSYDDDLSEYGKEVSYGETANK